MQSLSHSPFLPFPFLERSVEVRTGSADGGVLYLRSRVPLAPAAPHIPALLESAARSAPDRVWLAQRRGADRAWNELTYGAAKSQVDAVTQALLDMHRPGESVVMLGENSLEHAVLQLAAMQARMPFAAITPAYSLLAKDFTKLRSMVQLIDPAVVFVQDGARYQAALDALMLADSVAVVFVEHPVAGGRGMAWQDLAATLATRAVAASIEGITAQTVAKYLFSSGSTGVPKAITMTQGMLTAGVAMHGQTSSRALVGPPVQLSWMPWSHVAGGNNVFHNTIAAGGTLFLDEGKPVPGAFEETLRNLREVFPTQYIGVPAGYVMLVEALESDPSLARAFFRNLRTISFAGARMPEFVHDRLQLLAVRHTGFRIPVVSGWGMTESCAGGTYVHWNAEKVGIIGLPQPGVELKLVPIGENRYEALLRGPVLTGGYFRNAEQTAAAFDTEGFYRTGDALEFVDPQNPQEGLAFSGRVAEEFKLQTGTFVRVGALRVLALEAADGLLSDVVVTGADEAFVGLLAWINVERCRTLIGNSNAATAQLLASDALKERIRAAFQQHNRAHPASSARVMRVLLLSEPPSLAAGEITDKGYVNQRAVLARRAQAVRQLYATPAGSEVTVVGSSA